MQDIYECSTTKLAEKYGGQQPQYVWKLALLNLPNEVVTRVIEKVEDSLKLMGWKFKIDTKVKDAEGHLYSIYLIEGEKRNSKMKVMWISDELKMSH